MLAAADLVLGISWLAGGAIWFSRGKIYHPPRSCLALSAITMVSPAGVPCSGGHTLCYHYLC